MTESGFHTFGSYVKDSELTPSEEDYIEMIYRISIQKISEVTVKDLSQKLNVKPPSVSKMISKLVSKNLLTAEKYGCIKLTAQGESFGEKLLYRHNLIQNFLLTIGDTTNVLEKTEKIEHAIDSETLNSISILVDYLKYHNYSKQK